MNKNIIIVIALGVVVVLGVWWYIADQRNNSGTIGMQEQTVTERLQQGTDTVQEKTNMLQQDLSAMIVLSTVLEEQNDSNQDGGMTVVDENGKAKVIIKIASGAKDVAQPAHLHVGACPTPGAIAYPLTNVVNGASETILPISVEELEAKLPLAVNVHKSAAEVNTYVSCGDVTQETDDEE